MIAWVEQRLMFVLPVQIDQLLPQCLKRARRRQRVVDERAASSRGRDFAAEDDLATLGVFNDRLNHGFGFPGP